MPLRTLLALCFFMLATAVSAQTIPVVMLSDLHFDPLHDPAKASRLAAAPIAQWPAILAGPASPHQALEFEAIQKVCLARGIDSDYALIEASLNKSAKQSPQARFVTVSGDLLVHSFECRYKAATLGMKGYEDFAQKTTNFVIQQVESHFPRVPVYVALGNNDSSCGDYRMDLHDDYLKATADSVMAGLLGAGKAELAQARDTYTAGGYFAVTLPGVKGTRLLVIDDIFLSRKYTTCGNHKDSAGEDAILKWLGKELEGARARGEAVWTLAHIPPGVDVYNTVFKMRDVCGGARPELFLEDSAFADLLGQYPETVRLALFGHTHSDELRLLGRVPAKLIASVTPVNGNSPSFTVAQIDSQTARLKDYAVFVAPDHTGSGAWAQEYDFARTYGLPEFDGASLRGLISGFQLDTDAKDPKSQAYERGFFPGGSSPLALVWPQAGCSLAEHSEKGYRACFCKATKE